MKHSVTTVLIVLLTTFAGTLTFAAPAHAQAGESAPTQAPAGIGILILLLGLGAVALVGFSYMAQARADREDANPREFAEEDE
jgi:hypothetical protein